MAAGRLQGFVVSGLRGTITGSSFGRKKMAELNGTYWLDAGAEQRHGCSNLHQQEGGSGTLDYDGNGCWCLREFHLRYYCMSSSSTPPLSGWEVVNGIGTEPPPTLSPATPAQARPLPAPAAPAHVALNAGQQ